VGHGTQYHAEGFGSPVGKLKGINLAIEDMSPVDLKAYAIYEGERVTLEFEGGVTVTGEIITGTRNPQGKIIIISFKDCTVTHNDTVLFRPEWGNYDMAVGKKIVSAFSGPADMKSFDMITHMPSSKTIKAKKSAEREELEGLYAAVRNIRLGKQETKTLTDIFNTVKDYHSNDWLLSVEIAELLASNDNPELLQQVMVHLATVKQNRPEVAHLIDNGLELIFEKEKTS